MKYNPDIHHRKTIRLKDYDYSKQGMYFITICTQNREHLFGEIIDDKMLLNNAGEMIEKIWFEIPKFYNGFELYEFVIMPNHIHGIIEIIDNVGANPCICPNLYISSKKSLQQQGEHGGSPLQKTNYQISISELIQRFKTLTTNKYIRMVKDGVLPSFDKRIWQRNYYENIIRNEEQYLKVSEYIINNPLKWHKDKYYK
jgi:putative transposase